MVSHIMGMARAHVLQLVVIFPQPAVEPVLNGIDEERSLSAVPSLVIRRGNATKFLPRVIVVGLFLDHEPVGVLDDEAFDPAVSILVPGFFNGGMEGEKFFPIFKGENREYIDKLIMLKDNSYPSKIFIN